MSTIKRYEGACDSFGVNLMEGDPVGEYVLFSDHEAEVEKYRQMCVRLLNDMQDFVDKVDRGEAKSKRSYTAFKTSIEFAARLGMKPDA